ncbi:MAG: glycoside hydrolase family 16 protein [Prevotella sp.]|nr:glycoside hydrolase family 16 protein [Prevotella sp.]
MSFWFDQIPNIRMSRIVLLLSFALAFPMMVMAQDRWKLIWSDEFDIDGSFNTDVWTPERGFVRNHEDQWYQGENAFCQDGCLVIEARREKRENPMFTGMTNSNDWRRNRKFIEYTSASLTTRRSFSFTYGRLEVRARIPTAGGAWPAIWLLGKSMEWPSCGEIDVMEYYRINGVPHILANACWGSDRRYQAVWNSKRIPYTHFTDGDSQWAEKFHVWRMDWTPQTISIFLDDELLNEIPLSDTVNGTLGNGSNPFHAPQYILLNLALGGDNGGVIDDSSMPMRYEIDYVRVFQCHEP